MKDPGPRLKQSLVLHVYSTLLRSKMKTTNPQIPCPALSAGIFPFITSCYLLLLLCITKPQGSSADELEYVVFLIANKMLTECCLSVLRELFRVSLRLLCSAGTLSSTKRKEGEPDLSMLYSAPWLIAFIPTWKGLKPCCLWSELPLPHT